MILQTLVSPSTRYPYQKSLLRTNLRSGFAKVRVDSRAGVGLLQGNFCVSQPHLKERSVTAAPQSRSHLLRPVSLLKFRPTQLAKQNQLMRQILARVREGQQVDLQTLAVFSTTIARRIALFQETRANLLRFNPDSSDKTWKSVCQEIQYLKNLEAETKDLLTFQRPYSRSNAQPIPSRQVQPTPSKIKKRLVKLALPRRLVTNVRKLSGKSPVFQKSKPKLKKSSLDKSNQQKKAKAQPVRGRLRHKTKRANRKRDGDGSEDSDEDEEKDNVMDNMVKERRRRANRRHSEVEADELLKMTQKIKLCDFEKELFGIVKNQQKRIAFKTEFIQHLESILRSEPEQPEKGEEEQVQSKKEQFRRLTKMAVSRSKSKPRRRKIIIKQEKESFSQDQMASECYDQIKEPPFEKVSTKKKSSPREDKQVSKTRRLKEQQAAEDRRESMLTHASEATVEDIVHSTFEDLLQFFLKYRDNGGKFDFVQFIQTVKSKVPKRLVRRFIYKVIKGTIDFFKEAEPQLFKNFQNLEWRSIEEQQPLEEQKKSRKKADKPRSVYQEQTKFLQGAKTRESIIYPELNSFLETCRNDLQQIKEAEAFNLSNQYESAFSRHKRLLNFMLVQQESMKERDQVFRERVRERDRECERSRAQDRRELVEYERPEKRSYERGVEEGEIKGMLLRVYQQIQRVRFSHIEG